MMTMIGYTVATTKKKRKQHGPVTLRFRKSLLEMVSETGMWPGLPDDVIINKLHIPTEFIYLIEQTVEWMGYQKAEIETQYGESEHHVFFVIKPMEIS